mgnify:FL=1
MPLYFAYGSNMDVSAMAVRCPASRPLGPARLAQHRFLVNTDGYATVARDPREDVHGVLFDLALRDLPALDRYEDVARGLYTKIVQPVITPAGARKALVYIGRSSEAGKPRAGYMEGVVAAAQAAALPAKYLDMLRALCPTAMATQEPASTAPRFRAIGAAAR